MTDDEDLGLDHDFLPNIEYPRFCVFRLEDGPCGWANWLHPTFNEGDTK